MDKLSLLLRTNDVCDSLLNSLQALFFAGYISCSDYIKLIDSCSAIRVRVRRQIYNIIQHERI